MAITSGTAPWYEKYGMTVMKNSFDIARSSSYLFIPEFDLPVGIGTTRYIVINDGVIQIYPIRLEYPELEYLQFPSYFLLGIPGLSSATNLLGVYYYNETSAMRILIEYVYASSVQTCEIVFYSTGNIQVHNTCQGALSLSTSFPALGARVSGTLAAGGSAVFVLNSTSGVYTLRNGYYETSGCTTATKIISKVVQKTNVTPYYRIINVYGTNISGDTASSSNSKKLRINTPKGVGYIKTKAYSASDQKLQDQIYVYRTSSAKGRVLDRAPNPNSNYEWVEIKQWVETEVKNVTVGGSSNYYWTGCTQYTFDTIEDTVYNIASFGIYHTFTVDSNQYPVRLYSNNIYMRYYYETSRSSSFISSGTSATSGLADWYALANKPADTSYAINGMYGVMIDVGTSSNKSLWHWLSPVRNLFVKTKTAEVVR